jgi:cytochrome P450
VYASANRDETVFESADRFILNRPNIRESLAFGRGPHNCPGAALARLQLRVALEELLARTTHFEIAGPIIPTRMPEIGVLSVKMRFTANPHAL